MLLQQLPRHQRAQRNPEQHQHRLGQDRRQRQRPARDRGDADRDHRAGNQPARQVCPQEQRAAGGADRKRLEHAEDVGAAGNGRGHRCGDQAHAALWQIRAARDKCAHATAAMRVVDLPCLAEPCSSLRLGGRGLLACGTEFLALLAVQSLGVGFLRAFQRGCGPRLLRLSLAAGAAADFAAGAGVAGAVVCAKAAPINSRDAKAVAAAREEMFIMGAPRIKKGAPSRRDAEPRMNEPGARSPISSRRVCKLSARALLSKWWPSAQPPRCRTLRCARMQAFNRHVLKGRTLG